MDCATYPVPLNYADRADGTVDLTLYRHPATDPAHRVGTLFVNPGGPGELDVQDDGKDLLGRAHRSAGRRRPGPHGYGSLRPSCAGCLLTMIWPSMWPRMRPCSC